MKLALKLFAGLGEYLPADAKQNAILIDASEHDCVLDVVAKYNIPQDMIHLVLLNGVYLHPDLKYAKVQLSSGHIIYVLNSH